MKFKLLILLIITALPLLSLMKEKSESHDHFSYFTEQFATPQDVTKACLECHDEAAVDFMKTRHWNWEGEEIDMPGHSNVKFGKKNIINNFCIAIESNYPRCTSCHAGYGWKDKNFDFTQKENVDCLVCHDNSSTYVKSPTGAGMPDPSVDLLKVAQSVGKPRVENCGVCHFNGGGGEAVKHGDLDPALLKKDKNVDVHIGGKGFDCTTCHTAENHKIKGASHGSLASGSNHISCENCHNSDKGKVHKNSILEKHTNSIACETCHIPLIGKNMPTKTYWDWSTAGQKEDQKDADGKYIYSKLKGDFRWESNVVPDYQWFNGSANYYFPGDKIDPSYPVNLNEINGSIADKNSKIAPFKKMIARQPYDKVNNIIIIPKLFGEDGFWKTFDWVKASEIGMKEAGLAFSGEVGFIETIMWWSQNHGVLPKDNALKCNDCHNKGKRMDWEALGYSGDPMKKGGRVKSGILK